MRLKIVIALAILHSLNTTGSSIPPMRNMPEVPRNILVLPRPRPLVVVGYTSFVVVVGTAVVEVDSSLPAPVVNQGNMNVAAVVVHSSSCWT